MFQSITWGEYLYYLLIVVSVYYVLVLIFYFSRDIAWLFNGGRPRPNQGEGERRPVDSV